MQQGGDLGRAKYCWEKAATGHLAQKSPWHAAKALELAGEAARDARQWDDVKDCFERASQYYLEEGRPATAAEAYVKAAKALETVDPAAASAFYSQAIDWVEDSGKDAIAGDTYRQAIAHLVRSENWPDAVSMLLRFATSCHRCNARSSQCKAYLSAVVVWFWAGNASEAWNTYQDALAVSEFASSDEAFAAEALVEGYRSGDVEAVKEAVKGHRCMVYLDACIVKLVKNLPGAKGVELMGGMSAVLGGDGVVGNGLDEEEDLT